MPGLWAGKPRNDILRRDRADVAHLSQFLRRRLHQRVQRAEGLGQHLGCLLSYLTDAEGKDQTADVVLFAGLDRRQELLRGLAAAFPEAFQLVQRQIIDVCRGTNSAHCYELLDDGIAQSLNIHGIARHKMRNVSGKLRRALRTGAADGRTVRIALHGRAADRAGRRKMIGLRPRRALFLHHGEDFGDDLPGLADADGIADADVLFGNKVLVMQGGICDGRSRQPYRTDHRLRRQDAGSSNLHCNVLHNRFLDLRRILVGAGPAREFRRTTKHRAVGEVVQLDDRTVDVKGIVIALLPNAADLRNGLLRRAVELVRDHLEMPLGKVVQRLRMRIKLHILR